MSWASGQSGQLPAGDSLTPDCIFLQPQDQITITGYEKNTEAARDAILKIVAELEQMVSEDVPLDHRVHARIIGARGKAIRKVMDEFKVRVLEAKGRPCCWQRSLVQDGPTWSPAT